MHDVFTELLSYPNSVSGMFLRCWIDDAWMRGCVLGLSELLIDCRGSN